MYRRCGGRLGLQVGQKGGQTLPHGFDAVATLLARGRWHARPWRRWPLVVFQCLRDELVEALLDPPRERCRQCPDALAVRAAQAARQPSPVPMTLAGDALCTAHALQPRS